MSLMVKKIFRAFLLTGFCLGVSSCATLRAAREVEIPKQEAPQEYLAVFLNGKKVGHSTQSRIADSNSVITIMNEVITLDRFGTTVQTARYTKHVEGPDGEPRAFEYIEKTDSKFWFFHEKKSKRIECVKKEDGHFEATRTSNGKTRNFEIEWPQALLLSEGLRLLLKETGLKEGEKFSAKEIFEYDPFEICDEEGTIGQTKDISLEHNTVALTEIFLTAHSRRYGKIPMVACVDKDFNTKKIAATFGGFKLEFISCSREFAMGKTEKIDLTNMAVILCPVRLRNPEKAKRITYHLIPASNTALEIPGSDNQSVRAGEDGSLFVTVHPAKARNGISFPYRGNDKTAQEALKPTEILQCDDERIIALAHKAVGKTRDAAKAARKIEAFVNGHIQASGSAVFASAVDVAGKRKGDCTEYAVLTAALCRAEGIPARVVSGYAYFDYYNGKWNVFVPHAWTEVYIGDKWIGLDATKNRFFGMFNSFTAGYIALSGIGDKPDLSGLSTLGAFKIRHVEQ